MANAPHNKNTTYPRPISRRSAIETLASIGRRSRLYRLMVQGKLAILLNNSTLAGKKSRAFRDEFTATSVHRLHMRMRLFTNDR